MSREYAPIASRPIRAGAIVRQPARGTLAPVSLEDPAVAVMTDLASVPGVGVDPDVGIEAAMRIMVRQVVRGVFSASQLESQLGTPVSPSVGVRTFAEIKTALDRN